MLESSTQAEKGYKELGGPQITSGLSLKLTLLKLFAKSLVIFRNISHLYKEFFQTEFVRNAILKMFPESLTSKLDSKVMNVLNWTDLVKILLKSEKEINRFLESAKPSV